ncbi:MAG: hypothetical protein UY75_C0005G0007 [Parcubacteria group bacterium GW2011_GWC2_52_8c]|nr:MAG: hypothetical protein UY75_C0005G0007 [Parcubacteria group bacterium GW2011_GWC2_52_8c]
MKRLQVLVLIVSITVPLFSLVAMPATAEAIDFGSIPQNLGVALVNIPGSLVNGVKGAMDEIEKRGVVAAVSGWGSFGLNTGTTAASSGFTIGTLGLVPPVKNAWSGDPPPFVLPK